MKAIEWDTFYPEMDRLQKRITGDMTDKFNEYLEGSNRAPMRRAASFLVGGDKSLVQEYLRHDLEAYIVGRKYYWSENGRSITELG